MRKISGIVGRLILVIDGRRASAQDIENYVDNYDASTAIWILSNTPMFKSSRVSAWLTDLELDKVFEASKTSNIVFLKELKDSSYVKTAVGRGELQFEFVHDSGRRWSRSAHLPIGFFDGLSRLDSVNFFDGILPPRVRDINSAPPSTALSAYPTLLFVCHTDILEPLGGVQNHVRGLIAALRDRQRVMLLTRNPQGFLVRDYSLKQEVTTTIPFDWGANRELVNPTADVELSKFLRKQKIDVVHFHHVAHLCWSLVAVAKKQAKTYFSFHDYHAYCRRYDLIGPDGSFCGFCGNESRCNSPKNPSDYEAPLKEITAQARRDYAAQVLKGTLKIAPSSNLMHSLIKHLGIPADEIRVLPIPIGSERRTAKWTKSAPLEVDRDQLVLGFVGVFSEKKGARLFARLTKQLSVEFPNLKWKVFGEISDFALAEELINQFGVEFLGPYDQENISFLLERESVDIGLILSIWPETYSLTLSEVMNAGCVPIVTDLGAQADRVAQSKCGWVVSVKDTVEDVRTIMNAIKFDPQLLAAKRSLIPANGSTEMLKDYLGLYEPIESERTLNA
jgi:glycosyltransferase involved in cell wall biosynthesis